MSKFTKVSTSSILTNSTKTIKVEVNKYIKNGTKRNFWAASYDGKRVSRTMFSTLGSCERDARNFMVWLSKQN